MHFERRRLMVLLNALHDEGVQSIPIEYPCEENEELVRIELEANVRSTQGR